MLERGHLVLVPYPFTDLSATRRRPVLVLTASDAYGDFIGLPVTSRQREDGGAPITQADMAEGRLPAPSWVRWDRVVTLSSNIAVKTVGRVSEGALHAVADRFCAHLGCSGQVAE